MESELVTSFLYVAAGVIAAVIVHLVFLYLKGRAEKSETRMDDLIVHACGTPLVILAFFIPLYFAIQHAIIVYPGYAWFATSTLIYAGYILVITWIVASFVDGLLDTYGDALARTTESDLDDRIIDILQKIAKYIIWFIGILYILGLYNVNITPLIAGAGVIGIAIALAAQDLFSNFFGGAIIITDQPFKVGDRVLVNDILGDVVHIGPRSTRVVTLDGDIVTIPNNKITTSVVRNYSLPSPQGRVLISVAVAHGTDVEKIRSTLDQILTGARKDQKEYIAEKPESTIYLVKIDKSAMTFEITLFAEEYTYINIIRDHINTRIIETFRKEGIILA
ncbi:MAG: mechanosensitive ion channel family protein [Methanomicrobiales archaeon]|nr:mechanosensitive ion channel family protein [Methanomicrobiales archaeon]